MYQFKLTLKASNGKELDFDFVKKVMKHLRKYCGQLDEPDDCNKKLSDVLTVRQLQDLSLVINGNDWYSVMQDIGDLKLVGSKRSGDFCPECGHPDYYYTGGRMLCNQCEYSEEAEDFISLGGDITDYSGRVVI